MIPNVNTDVIKVRTNRVKVNTNQATVLTFLRFLKTFLLLNNDYFIEKQENNKKQEKILHIFKLFLLLLHRFFNRESNY